MSKIDWSEVMNNDNIDVMNSVFEETVLEVMEEAAPLKILHRRKFFRNWISEEVKSEMKIRDGRRETARHSKWMEDWVLYRQTRNKCVKLLSKSKKYHYQNLYTQI